MSRLFFFFFLIGWCWGCCWYIWIFMVNCKDAGSDLENFHSLWQMFQRTSTVSTPTSAFPRTGSVTETTTVDQGRMKGPSVVRTLAAAAGWHSRDVLDMGSCAVALPGQNYQFFSLFLLHMWRMFQVHKLGELVSVIFADLLNPLLMVSPHVAVVQCSVVDDCATARSPSY